MGDSKLKHAHYLDRADHILYLKTRKHFSAAFHLPAIRAHSNPHVASPLYKHINVEAGLSLMKSTIAESGMGVTSRPYRTKHIEF